MFFFVVWVSAGCFFFFFFQAEDGIRDDLVTGVQTCALPICVIRHPRRDGCRPAPAPDLAGALCQWHLIRTNRAGHKSACPHQHRFACASRVIACIPRLDFHSRGAPESERGVRISLTGWRSRESLPAARRGESDMASAVQKIKLSPSRDIPFNKLVLSQSNVRRVKAGVSIEQLAESIAQRTLLQSLSVRAVIDGDGRETGMFEVPAGGRRYRALELLVKQKRMAKTQAVPCVVRDEGLAEDDSLAENDERIGLLGSVSQLSS